MSAISSMFAEGEFMLKLHLSDEEIVKRQADYFTNLEKIRIQDQILLDAKATHKSQTKPLAEKNEELYVAIHEGVETKKVRALEVMNEDSFTVDYLDPEHPDTVLSTRDMTPSEKTQYKIKFSRKEKENQFN